MIKKFLASVVLASALLLPATAFAQLTVPQGGTGSTTLSGILYGIPGNLRVQTLKIGSGLQFLAGTLSAVGGSSASSTLLSDSNTFSGLNTFIQTIVGSITGNAGTATKLSTGRTISITGDLAYTSPSFDGSSNVTAAGTLATVNGNVGTFTYPSVTVNGKGLITAISNGTAPTTYTGVFPISVSGSVISSLFSTTTNSGLSQGNLYVGSGGIFQTSASSSIFGYTPEQPLTFIAPLIRTSNSIAYTGLVTTTQPASSNVLTSNGTNGVYGTATTSVTCTGNATCTAFSVLGPSPITINVAAGTAASSTLLGDSNTFSGILNSFTNPIKIGTLGGLIAGNAGLTYAAATSSIGAGTGLSFSGVSGAQVGGTAGTFSVNTTQNITTLSNLTSGTVNSSSGVLYNTSTSTPTVTAPITYGGTLGSFIGGISGTFGCTAASAGVTGCLSGTDYNTFSAKQAALTFTWPLINTTNTITFGGLSTSTPAVLGNIPYFSGVNTFANVATGTVANGTGISVTAGQSVIGSGLTITNTGVTSNVAGTGISVSGATGAVTITNTGVTSLVAGTGISISGSTGAVTVNDTNGYPFTPSTFGINVSATSTPLYPSGLVTGTSTIGTLTASSTVNLPFITGTQCLHTISGVVSGTGSDCSAGSSLTGTTGQTAYFSGTNTAVGTSSIFISTNGQVSNKNGDVFTSIASYIVSTSTATGNFTDVQTAINALPTTGGYIQVRCGTYTLPTATYGILIKTANTVIDGAGNCTQFNFDKANTPNAFGVNATGLGGIVIRNAYFHQTNGTFGGIGVNASNTPLFIASNLKIDGTATATLSRDTVNQTFYQTWNNLDLRDNTSCVQVGDRTSNPVNDDVWSYVRCAPHSGNAGNALYVDANTVNGDQNLKFDQFDSEPTGAATAITALNIIRGIDVQFNGAYVEGNAVAYKIGSDSQRITFNGGEMLTNTTYTNSGSNTQFLNFDKEGIAVNQLTASTSIVDVTGNDASVPDLSISGNNSFAKTGDLVRLLFANSTDSGNGLFINNPGTGFSIDVNSGTSTFANAFLVGTTTQGAGAGGNFMEVISNAAAKIGGLVIRTWTNVTNALTIVNAAGTTVFNVDTTATNPFLGVGTTTPWATLSAVGDGTDPVFAVSTSTSNNVLPNFEIDKLGHVVTSGPKPVCTTNCTFKVGNDNAFRITAGSAVTSMTVTFSNAWSQAPICHAEEGDAATAVMAASSTATQVIITTAVITAKDVEVICLGIQ